MYQENPEKEGNWISRSYQFFNQLGTVIWPEQKRIYWNLKERIKGKRIVEAGCGIGYGTALLHFENEIIGTDKNLGHIKFAKEIYPWCNFDLWDISENPYEKHDVVIAVEVIEHIKEYKKAIGNLLKSGNEIYISTPNRNHPDLGKNRPVNTLHVREFTPRELIDLLGNPKILHWETFEELNEDTQVSPLVYVCKS